MTVPAARTPRQVQQEVLALLPDGFASSRDVDDYNAAVYLPVATELSLIEGSMLSMLPQIDPRQAPNLLPDWERMLGPDPCQAANPITDTETRSQIAFERLTNSGTICAGYFERYALSLGQTITIDEFPAYVLGLVECGRDMLVQPPEHCAFVVDLQTTGTVFFDLGVSQLGIDSLGAVIPNVMECVIRNGAPLYTTPYFNYSP